MKKSLFLVATILLVLTFACQKSATSLSSSLSPQTVSIYLTDDPSLYDNVFIDISSIKVRVDTCRDDNEVKDDHEGDSENNDSTIEHNDHDSTDEHEGVDDHNSTDEDEDFDDDSCKIWVTLNIQAGVYDLLTL